MRFRIGHKFKAIAVKEDGHHFPSKLEWAYFRTLEAMKASGEVVFFLRQVPFHLPGGVKYVLDYQVFYANGDIKFIDVKGMETAEFKMKKKLVESLYPITIDIVKRENFKRR